MRLLRLATLLLLLAPSLGLTQTTDVAAKAGTASWQIDTGQPAPNTTLLPPADTAQPVMPLWSTADGRILAIVAWGSANRTIPALTPAPLVGSAVDWALIDVTDFVDLGLSLRLNDGARAYTKLSGGAVSSPRPFLSPGDSANCLTALPLPAANRCAGGDLIGRTGTVRLGAALSAGAFDFDLNYGLSWLRYADPQRPNPAATPAWDLFSVLGDRELPTLLVPGLEFANRQDSALTASGRWRFGEEQSLDLGASLGRIQFELPGAAPLPYLNQAALRFGLRHGDFSGVIVGRVLGPGDLLGSGQRWSTIDLGISWRAPWRGVFSVGAQNLWSSGSPNALEPNARETDPGLSRVPYVQYHQDL